MAHQDVHIAADGTPDPENFGTLDYGDTLGFHADGADTVICFPSEDFFGTSRLAIANAGSQTVTVQPGAPQTELTYTISVGDLSAECGGGLGGEEEGFGAIGFGDDKTGGGS